jgi:hypothetical protein
VFVLLLRREPQRLAEVFLRQPRDPGTVVHPRAVEALDHQDGLVAEGRHRRWRDGQAEFRDDLGTDPFVLD